MKTSIYKCPFHKSWVAETSVSFTENTIIIVRTSKTHSGALVTQATRYVVDGNIISYVAFSDFSKRYSISNLRCTEKNITNQHQSVISDIEKIKFDCSQFYCNK